MCTYAAEALSKPRARLARKSWRSAFRKTSHESGTDLEIGLQKGMANVDRRLNPFVLHLRNVRVNKQAVRKRGDVKRSPCERVCAWWASD